MDTDSGNDVNHTPSAVLYTVNLHEKMQWIIENSVLFDIIILTDKRAFV